MILIARKLGFGIITGGGWGNGGIWELLLCMQRRGNLYEQGKRRLITGGGGGGGRVLPTDIPICIVHTLNKLIF